MSMYKSSLYFQKNIAQILQTEESTQIVSQEKNEVEQEEWDLSNFQVVRDKIYNKILELESFNSHAYLKDLEEFINGQNINLDEIISSLLEEQKIEKGSR